MLILFFIIDQLSRCKLKDYILTHTKKKPLTTNQYFFAIKVRRVSKLWVRMSTTNIHLLKFKVTCKNMDFECRCIRTHTKEKPSHISNITSAILPFLSVKCSNWMVILIILNISEDFNNSDWRLWIDIQVTHLTSLPIQCQFWITN